MTQAYSEKEIPSSPNRSRTYDLPITSSDAPPPSYRRLVGAEAASIRTSNRKVVDSTPVGRTRNFFFRVCLCHSLKKISFLEFKFFFTGTPLTRICQLLEYDQIIKPEFVSFLITGPEIICYKFKHTIFVFKFISFKISTVLVFLYNYRKNVWKRNRIQNNRGKVCELLRNVRCSAFPIAGYRSLSLA